MSYPTPWRVEINGDILSADNQVVATNIDGYGYYFENDTDDLVSRINAGAEAEARAERAEGALKEIVRMYESWSSARSLAQHILDGGTIKGLSA